MRKVEQSSSHVSWAQNVFSKIPKEALVYDDLMYKIICELHEFMREKNITQKALAGLIGVKESFISKVLSGDRNITIKSLARILCAIDAEMSLKIHACGVNIDWRAVSMNDTGHNKYILANIEDLKKIPYGDNIYDNNMDRYVQNVA